MTDLRFQVLEENDPYEISKISFRIYRRDTELRFVAKFGENRPLRSCRKVVWITTQKNSGSAGLVPSPILPKMGRSRPKFPDRCHHLTCPRIPNLVRIYCDLPDLFRKDLFFASSKSCTDYNHGHSGTTEAYTCIFLCRQASPFP